MTAVPGRQVPELPAAALYGIGVGPGDPELMTLKAVRLLREADVVFCPRGPHGPGRAHRTAEAHMVGKRVVELDFEFNEDARAAAAAAAERVVAELVPGTTGAFITEGDVSLYSTFGRLRESLREVAPELRTIAVPGVSSLNAAAAASGFSLAQGDETLAVLPASVPTELLKDALAVFDRVAILKPSMRPGLGHLLTEAGSLRGSVLVTEASSAQETVIDGEVQSDVRAPYFSLWLAPGARAAGGRVYFLGAGPGHASLLTRRALALLRRADLVVTADSLVMADVSGLACAQAKVIGSSAMTLEEIVELMVVAARNGQVVVRLHSGDPSVYGALSEQVEMLRDAQVPFEVVPGVSSAFAAAAVLGVELTVPGGAQTVILTRQGKRVPTPARERLRELARSRATLGIFLSAAAVQTVQQELLAGGLSGETPAAVAYRVSWPDQLVVRTTVAGLVEVVRRHRLRRHTLILVGEALVGTDQRSRLYDPGHAHIFRRRRPPRLPAALGNVALVAVTRPGLDLAHRVRRAAPGVEILAPAALAHPEDTTFTSAADCVRTLFRAGRPLVLFMAVGAAVRLLAPELAGKALDPAVVVVDDAADFAVSLLGGRSAGANRLAEWTAAVLGARPLVTTAAERLNLPALDDLLRRRGWQVVQGGLTHLEGAVVNGEEILFYGPGLRLPTARLRGARSGAVKWRRMGHLSGEEAATAKGRPGLAVSDRELGEMPAGWVLARPGSLVVGVGCALGVADQEVHEAVMNCLARCGLSPEGVSVVATIERRRNHSAVSKLAVSLGAELVTFSPEQLAQVHVPTGSETVRDAVGTPSVAEAAALLASHGRLLQPKVIRGQVTVAIAETSGSRRSLR
ncbi:MAG: precorrin-4 C(11)-methyltransferase [Candidatus Dormibacteria bacterium]